MFPEDPDGNVFVGDHVAVDSTGNTVFSPARLVGLVGVRDVVVVDGGGTRISCARGKTFRRFDKSWKRSKRAAKHLV